MHVEFAQVLRGLLALGFGTCVVGFLLIINTLRHDMRGDGQRARYYSLLAGCFAGAVGTAEQVHQHTPLGLRVYATVAFLVTAIMALHHTRCEVRRLRSTQDWRGPRPGRRRS
jgi:hypothetical protein